MFRSALICGLLASAAAQAQSYPTPTFQEVITANDVRYYGAVADGVTDNTAAINNALTNAPGCVIIPASTSGFYVAGTITVIRCMRGTVWMPSAAGGDFSNSSRIICNNQAVQSCVVVNRSPTNMSAAQIENVSIIGIGGTPVDGSTGFQWKGGFNLVLTNVQSANFGSCAYFGPNSGGGPISMHSYNLMLSRCSKHYVVADGAPELYFMGGRWGENGGTDYNADDFFYGTTTANGGAAGGPNTIVFDSIQMNPGGKTIGCAFRWGGFQYPNGIFSANKMSNLHVEVQSGAGYSGGATRGMFCADSTVPKFPGLQIVNSEFGEDGTKSIPFFNVDSAVPYNDNSFKISNSVLCSLASTLTISGVVSGHGPVLDGNYICGNQTFAAGDTTANLTLSNNVASALTVSGQWGDLVLNNNNALTGFTDNATGTVFGSNNVVQTWTPSLSATGATFTYTTHVGTWTRTPNGGLLASFNIALSNVSGGSGAVQITGLPKNCGGRAAGNALNSYAALTGLTGAIWASWVSGAGAINILQSGAASAAPVQVANLTNTTAIIGSVTCGQAQ